MQPYTIVDYVPQSGTKNLASGFERSGDESETDRRATNLVTNFYGNIAVVLFGLGFFPPASQDVYVESNSENANIAELDIK